MPLVTFVSTARHQSLKFKEGDVVPIPGSLNRMREVQPVWIEFQKGIYQTSDPEEIEFIRSRMHDVPSIQEITEKTDPAPVLEALTQLAVERDAKQIHDVLMWEREGEQRDIVLETCQRLLDTLKTQEAEGEPLATRPPGRPKAKRVEA